jgi:hypothetical protein
MAPLTLTSHTLCPFLHSWIIALSLAGLVPGKDFAVRRLTYPDRHRWKEAIPDGMSLPFLIAGRDMLDGGLPVLQFFEETLSASRLLPEGPADRARIRKRAVLAADLLDVMRCVFVASSPEEERRATEKLFAGLSRCEAQEWSAEPRLDRVILAGGSTVLAGQPKLAGDPRWSACPAMRALTRALSEEEVARTTRAEDYDAAFAAFLVSFAGTYAKEPVVLARQVHPSTPGAGSR